jgi:hypothetical protein
VQRIAQKQGIAPAPVRHPAAPTPVIHLQRLQVDALNAFAQAAIATFGSLWDLNLTTGRMAIDRVTEQAYRLIQTGAQRRQRLLCASTPAAPAVAPASPPEAPSRRPAPGTIGNRAENRAGKQQRPKRR